jgi:hypothetical protein
MGISRLSRRGISLVLTATVTCLFASAFDLPGKGVAWAEVMEGKFDTSGGTNVLRGNFVSDVLAEGTAPAVDAHIQAILQGGGFQYEPLGWSYTGESEWCDDGLLFGNLYFTSDPRLTAFWGADTIIFIPAGMRCGTGMGDALFGVGEAILVIYIGPQVPAGYFAPVDVIEWSGGNVAIAAGLSGMLLSLDAIQ